MKIRVRIKCRKLKYPQRKKAVKQGSATLKFCTLDSTLFALAVCALNSLLVRA